MYTAPQMRRRHPAFSHKWAAAVVIAASIFVASGFTAQAHDESVKVHGELGAEVDSNVHWAAQAGNAEDPPHVASVLARGVLGISAAGRVGSDQDVAFSVLGAAKTFAAASARSENVAVVDTSGTWRAGVGPRTRLGLSAAYYEAIQAGTQAERELSRVARDFRSLSPTVRALRAVGASGTLGFAGGYRWFTYKPLRAYDFGAPVAAIEYRWTREAADGAADWEAITSAGLELRRFTGARLVRESSCTSSMCTAISDPAGVTHSDQFLAGRIDITRTGGVLFGFGYAIQWNRSNSYSETLLRHAGTLRLTVPLPLGLYLAARSELVYVSYADRAAFRYGPSGQSLTTIDDENRSHLRAELSRDVSNHLQVIARYSLYVNAIGQGAYQRQTATLSLSVTID